MRSVWNVVTFDHLFVGQAAAFIADTTGAYRLEKGPPMLVLLLHELGVVVELVLRGTARGGSETVRRRGKQNSLSILSRT
jgi:hypothetical protein